MIWFILYAVVAVALFAATVFLAPPPSIGVWVIMAVFAALWPLTMVVGLIVELLEKIYD